MCLCRGCAVWFTAAAVASSPNAVLGLVPAPCFPCGVAGKKSAPAALPEHPEQGEGSSGGQSTGHRARPGPTYRRRYRAAPPGAFLFLFLVLSRPPAVAVPAPVAVLRPPVPGSAVPSPPSPVASAGTPRAPPCWSQAPRERTSTESACPFVGRTRTARGRMPKEAGPDGRRQPSRDQPVRRRAQPARRIAGPPTT